MPLSVWFGSFQNVTCWPCSWLWVCKHTIWIVQEHTWKMVCLNCGESNFVLFRPYQKRLPFQPKISIFDNEKNMTVPLDCKDYVKYLGILIDSNLSWKIHIEYIALKISESRRSYCKIKILSTSPHPITYLSVFNLSLCHLQIICLGSGL